MSVYKYPKISCWCYLLVIPEQVRLQFSVHCLTLSVFVVKICLANLGHCRWAAGSRSVQCTFSFMAYRRFVALCSNCMFSKYSSTTIRLDLLLSHHQLSSPCSVKLKPYLRGGHNEARKQVEIHKGTQSKAAGAVLMVSFHSFSF